MLYDNNRQCPHLGGKKGKEHHVDYPSSRNVCSAQVTYKKKFLRLVAYPYSSITAKEQREFCLWAYSRCPIYQRKEAKVFQT